MLKHNSPFLTFLNYYSSWVTHILCLVRSSDSKSIDGMHPFSMWHLILCLNGVPFAAPQHIWNRKLSGFSNTLHLYCKSSQLFMVIQLCMQWKEGGLGISSEVDSQYVTLNLYLFLWGFSFLFHKIIMLFFHKTKIRGNSANMFYWWRKYIIISTFTSEIQAQSMLLPNTDCN